MKDAYFKIFAGVGIASLIGFAVYSKKQEQKQLEANQVPQLTDLDYKTLANDLYVAMNQRGTDEDKIFKTLSGISENQFYKIILAFGKKKYNETLGYYAYGISTPRSLPFWLKSELSDEQYLTLKNNFKKYL